MLVCSLHDALVPSAAGLSAVGPSGPERREHLETHGGHDDTSGDGG